MSKGSRRTESLITKERLEELFDYDQENGLLRWRQNRRGGAKVGDVAGSFDGTKGGYRWVKVDGSDYLLQRLIWFWETGKWPDIIRFRNGDRTDCRFNNLRDSHYVEQGQRDWRTKEGKAAQQKEYRATIVDQIRDYRYRTVFGISLEQYSEMLEAQGGMCAICGKPETAMRGGKTRLLAVDHDHKTGKIRGLLCTRCNPMIGYADDDEEVLRQAIEYLRRHRED